MKVNKKRFVRGMVVGLVFSGIMLNVVGFNIFDFIISWFK